MAEATIKLFAGLMDYLPVKSTKAHGFAYDLDKHNRVGDIIDDLKLPRHMIHIVLLNGVYLPPESREDTVLQPGDVLGFWPPVAGG